MSSAEGPAGVPRSLACTPSRKNRMCGRMAPCSSMMRNLNPGYRASRSLSTSASVDASLLNSSVTVSAPFVYDRSKPGMRTCMLLATSGDLDGVDVREIAREAFPRAAFVTTPPDLAARRAEVNAHGRGRVRGHRLPLHRPP